MLAIEALGRKEVLSAAKTEDVALALAELSRHRDESIAVRALEAVIMELLT